MGCPQERTASRPLEALEWFANVMLWSGGTVLAVSPEMAKGSWAVFGALLTGQIFWAYSAFRIRKWTLLASSVFFAGLNLYAVLIRLHGA